MDRYVKTTVLTGLVHIDGETRYAVVNAALIHDEAGDTLVLTTESDEIISVPYEGLKEILP